MATVSASQPISTITPPHSSDGRTSWDYAVPLDEEVWISQQAVLNTNSPYTLQSAEHPPILSHVSTSSKVLASPC